jgi:hypothetical protein
MKPFLKATVELFKKIKDDAIATRLAERNFHPPNLLTHPLLTSQKRENF